VSDYIKDQLTNQKIRQLAPPYLAALRKEDGVEILDPDLKALEQQEEANMATNAPAGSSGE
ncbi:MAG TPA: hypothetical protein VMA13_06220, partial [Candidatus Saccharimonadales bacterium]|nr:hypothetical protein [Candidatus Saccharimonadales bacterium]